MKRLTEQFVIDYFKDVDTMHPEKVTSYYGENGSFKFGNAKAVIGLQAISEVLIGFYEMLRTMEHHKKGIWIADDSAVFETDVLFIKKNGEKVILPAVSILRTKNSKIDDFRMVMDAAPLFT